MFVLASFAVAQPIFDLLSRHGEFFLARRSGPADILLFTFLLLAGIGGILCVIEVLAQLIHPRAHEAVHLFLVGALSAALFLQVFKRFDRLSPAAVIALSLSFGLGAAVLYERSRAVRRFLTVLSPAPVIFAAYFLFVSPISRLMRPATVVSSPDAAAGRGTPVVFLVFDELPLSSLLRADGQIDSSRFPNFARLSAGSTWFRNATTVHDLSEMAVPAMLTGRFADASRLPMAGDYPSNLFTLLARSHRLEVFETLTRLCPESLCERAVPLQPPSGRLASLLSDTGVVYLHLLLPAAFAPRLPRIDQTWGDFRARPARPGERQRPSSANAAQRRADFERHVGAELTQDQGAVFESFLGSLDRPETPTLSFLHVMLPHVPWLYLPGGKHYAEGDVLYLLPGDVWPHDDYIVAQALQRYLLQLRFSDELLGRVMSRMRVLGLYDPSLLVVASDHGASFQPGLPRRRGTPDTLSEILPVPLFIKTPHQTGGIVNDRNAEIVDILPTIAHVLEVAVPWRMEGGSLFATRSSERADKSFFPDKGTPVRLPAGRVDSRKGARRIGDLFPRRNDAFDLYAFGPDSHLAGRETRDLSIAPALAGSFTLTASAALEDYRPSSFSPGRLTGHLTLVESPPTPWRLAFAVNGRIGATGKTFHHREKTATFSALVPESLFHPGRNHVELYVILGEGGALRLAPIQFREALRYSLTVPDGRGDQYLEASDGRRFLVAPGAVWGSVDGTVNRADLHTVIGWAADVSRDHCADAVVAVLGSASVATGGTHLQRSDVASYFDTPGLSCAGYSLDVPARALSGRSPGELRIFAIVGETASELMRQPKPAP